MQKPSSGASYNGNKQGLLTGAKRAQVKVEGFEGKEGRSHIVFNFVSHASLG